ncbi:hypothetical protein, conserved [Eimeria praecox]|uniref:Uncharacterized protein n=1 Tax=Eimeria praecox TaxID=51316 RepID=U6G4V0_9EIME|nr:hypothetical protein, conserved [Eimeria praecox]
MGAPMPLLPFWASLFFALSAFAGGPHSGALAEGPQASHGQPLGGKPVEIALEPATTLEKDVSVPSPATQGHRWCRTLDLHGAYGACRSDSDTDDGRNVLPQALDDGCFGLVLLLLLLLAADQAERLLRKVWGPISSLAKCMWCGSSDTNNGSSNNQFAAAAETGEGKKLLSELAALQQQLVQEQMQQQQLSATAEFAAYARKQRKIDQLVASRDAYIEQLKQIQEQQQPQQQRSKMLRAVYQLLLKPLIKRHGCTVAKYWGLVVTWLSHLPS